MHIIERAISVFAPHTCLGCCQEGCLLCDGCVASLETIPSRCYRCKAVTYDYATCKSCARSTPLRHVIVYTHHQSLAKELLHRMKYERARAGTAEIAAMLETIVPILDGVTVLCHVPTATSRVRVRGYDHAFLIARSLEAHLKIPAKRLLGRIGQAHQVGSNRANRIKQLQGSFRPIHPEQIRGKHVLLVDDVLTTGATLETAARVLKKAGAKRVSALVFAQA